MQGSDSMVSIFRLIIFWGFLGLFLTYIIVMCLQGWFLSITRRLGFLFVCFPLILSFNIYPYGSRWSQNSMSLLRFLEYKSKPWTSTYLFHSLGSVNLKILIVLFSGITWVFLNGGMFSKYSKMLLTENINLHILKTWGLNNPLYRYLFWNCSPFLGKKWFLRLCIRK